MELSTSSYFIDICIRRNIPIRIDKFAYTGVGRRGIVGRVIKSSEDRNDRQRTGTNTKSCTCRSILRYPSRLRGMQRLHIILLIVLNLGSYQARI